MPRKMISAKTTDGKDICIDAYRIESYTQVETDSVDCVEVTMYSGKQLVLSDELDQDLYEGDSLTTLLDSILWSDDNEVVD